LFIIKDDGRGKEKEFDVPLVEQLRTERWENDKSRFNSEKHTHTTIKHLSGKRLGSQHFRIIGQ
jgi:hypothetical protein